MIKKFWIFLFVAFLSLISIANAKDVYWVNWQDNSSDSVSGSIDLNTETVDVVFSGSYSFAQTNGGTNYWNPSTPYISSTVENAPPASDIIGLSTGGTATITFSRSVIDPIIAVVSWNGNTVDFGAPITILNEGKGYWGDGTPEINSSGTGFYGNGEVHGIIQLTGTYSSITFTHTSENWHGLTIGVTSAVEGDNTQGGCTQQELDAQYEAGKKYCIDNPMACGIDVGSDYQAGYDQGYIDGKAASNGSTPSGTTDNCSTFDLFSNTLHVPCFSGGSMTYWLDLEYTGSDPATFKLKDIGKN